MFRRSWAGLLGVVTVAAVVAVAQPPDKPAAAPADAKDKIIPMPFRAYMVNGPRVGKFHDPVGERELKPTVAVFVRLVPPKPDTPEYAQFTEKMKAVGGLLQKLNGLVGEHVNDLFGAFAEFLWLEKDFLEDENHLKYAEILTGFAAQAKLDKVQVGLAKVADTPVEAFGIDPNAEVTVIGYDRLTVKYRAKFGPEPPLDAAAIDAVAAEALKLLPSVKDKKKK